MVWKTIVGLIDRYVFGRSWFLFWYKDEKEENTLIVRENKFCIQISHLLGRGSPSIMKK